MTKTLCDACESAYRPKSSYEPVDALESGTLLFCFVLFFFNEIYSSSLNPTIIILLTTNNNKARKAGRLRGASRQLLWRGKFSDPLDAMMAFFVVHFAPFSFYLNFVECFAHNLDQDDGNSDRSRRQYFRDEKFQYCGIVWGKDGADWYLLLLLVEKFSDEEDEELKK